MYTKILLPLDGSALAAAMLPIVGKMAMNINATVVLLCAMQEPKEEAQRAGMVRITHALTDVLVGSSNPQVDPYTQQLEREQAAAQSVLDLAAATLRAQGINTETIVEFGDPAESILKVAKQHEVDLIAMGTHGRSGLSRLLLGSVAEYVMRHSTVAVLLLRVGDAAHL